MSDEMQKRYRKEMEEAVETYHKEHYKKISNMITTMREGRNISKRLKQARIDAGVTQSELAERIGVYQKDVSRWENGERTPSLEAFAKICRALGVSADNLLEIKCRVTENDTDTFICSACGFGNISYDDNRCPSCEREIDWKMSVECQ